MKLTYVGIFRIELLTYQLKSAVGELSYSLSYGGNQLELDFPVDVSEPTITAIVNAHNPDDLLPSEQDEQTSQAQKVIFRNLPEWATWTPTEARTNITNQVLTGQTIVQIETWINTNVTGTNIATLRAQLITALKLLAGGIVALRDIVALMGYCIMLLRDIVVRRTG